ncbi:secretin N-terminal domain-containing protein [Nitrogeniibacter aestuarii]|uniref:secretin N-terminal domain-containing protein n=1 Tax=Nitrogeniibacter aestuarii TaxID=2815343 RepID=UPI001E2F358E|nr:secretin N-terminal domain-containing protein [Nitrogeniibacter aestuarii]
MTQPVLVRIIKPVCIALVVLTLSACAHQRALESAQAEFEQEPELVAFERLQAKVKASPGNVELRTYYLNQRERLILKRLALAERMQRAGNTDEALRLYDEVLSLAPGEKRAERGRTLLLREQGHDELLARAYNLGQLGKLDEAQDLVDKVLAENPRNARGRQLRADIDATVAARQPSPAKVLEGPFAKPVTLEFRDAPLRVVFEALSDAAGINFVFDRDVRPDAKVTIFVRKTSVDEVIKLLTATQKIESKLLNANSVLIYPSTPAKTKEYRDLVTKTFYLANADIKQAQSLVRQLVKARDVFIDEKLNLMVVKDTPEAVALAEKLVTSLDVAEPEVMLEVEVLELSRTKVKNLGLDFPDFVGYGALDGSGVARTVASGVVDWRSRGDLRPYISNPSLLLNIRQEDSDTSLLANPRIRVKNKEEAKIHIGQKLPVFTTTATANVGVSASVSYLDVGLKLDVQPTVLLDDEVEIKIQLEVSNIVSEVTGPSDSLAYQLGTRTTGTVLRLHDGETQILAGLLQDEDRSVEEGLPGIADVPVLGRLFSTKRDNNARTEIVLLITPRVIRNVIPPSVARALLPSGTETNIGSAPLTLTPKEGKSLTLSGDGSPVGSGIRGRGFSTALRPAIRPSSTRGVILPDDEFPVEDPAQDPIEDPLDEAVPSGPLTVSVTGPAEVQAGGAIDVEIVVSGGGAIDGGEVSLRYDPGRVEAPGASEPGLLTVEVPPGQDSVTATASFLTRQGTIGSAVIAPVSASVGRGGQVESVTPSGAVTVSIKP